MSKKTKILSKAEQWAIVNEVRKSFRESIKVVDVGTGLDVRIVEGGQEVGSIALEAGEPGIYTIVGAKIELPSRGKGFYQKALIELLHKKPNITIISCFRSAEADRAWSAMLKKLPQDISFKREVEDGEITYTMFNRNAQGEVIQEDD